MKKVINQFAKFCVIGFMNTGLDFLVYAGVTRFFLFWNSHKILSACLAFLVANINSYIFNKYWTFTNKDKKHHIQYSKFFIVSITGLGINLLIFSMVLELGVYDLIAKIAPIPVVLIWNFLINKIWTFQDRQK